MRVLLATMVTVLVPAMVTAQANRPTGSRPDISAAITNVRYELTFDDCARESDHEFEQQGVRLLVDAARLPRPRETPLGPAVLGFRKKRDCR